VRVRVRVRHNQLQSMQWRAADIAVNIPSQVRVVTLFF
jgi:hypothetical protein